MLEKLTQRLPDNLAGMLKKLALPAGIAVAITAAVVAIMWQNNSQYTMLFGSQENIPIQQVVEVLSGEGLTYRVEPKSGNLLVRENELAKARMALAGKGISAHTPMGYELMDKEEMLGSSQFIQNVRLKRSLEGELAQSIMALDSVDFARVHLGISETSAFVLSNKPDSTASVMLRLKYGRQLNDDQVAAIVSLVSGSVPGLKPDQVRVVDQNGALLSANVSELLSGRNGLRSSGEMVQRLRQETERNIENLLTPVLGSENFRVSVVPRVDFSQVEETQERYHNDPRISQESLVQENTTEQLAVGIPGSLSNRPATAPAQNNNQQQQQLATRNQAQRQFKWDSDVRHIQHQGFQVERMTIAVVLNQSAPQLQNWDDAQQQQMLQMLSNAAGIDTARGDVLNLTRLAFTQPAAYEETVQPWWERDSTLLWAERGGLGLLALLVVLFGVLPMMRRIGNKPAIAAPVSALPEGVFVDDEAGSDEENAPLLQGNAFQSEENLPPQSSGLETKIAYLQTLAQSETDRVAEVMKQWINNNERSSSNK